MASLLSDIRPEPVSLPSPAIHSPPDPRQAVAPHDRTPPEPRYPYPTAEERSRFDRRSICSIQESRFHADCPAHIEHALCQKNSRIHDAFGPDLYPQNESNPIPCSSKASAPLPIASCSSRIFLF